MRKYLYTTLSALLFAGTMMAQSAFKVKIVHDARSDFGLGYNFFVGDNADDFRTTIRGFGSGFLFDAFTGRYSKDIVSIGTEGVNLTIGAGGTISKYRFSEPLILTDEAGVYGYTFDEDPTHSYGSGFFSNDKSKLVTGTFIFPVNLNITAGDFYLSGGGTMDILVTGKHKLKYTVDGERVTEVIKNDRFNDFPVNRLKWGLGAMIFHKPTGWSAGVTYMMTPFFKENSNFPELREVRVSLSYDLSRFAKGHHDL
jgi:hypothetical protein